MPGKSSPISLIHVSDIHLGSGENHGRLNPETGLNVRFEDFVQAFARTVDFALDSQADIFLFSGDAYRNASPEPMYQKAFAQQLHRLSQSGITTILLVGNHDQLLKSSLSHSMSVFQSLAVPNVITIDRAQLLVVETKNGACQIIGIPFVTRHTLMASEKYANLPSSEIDKQLVLHLRDVLNGFYEQLNPTLPAVATAHMMVDTARAGVEQELMIGYSMTFPADLFADERLDYVALGHVHGYQILRAAKPPIVYAGSIERIDFSEQNEDKGFVHVRIKRGSTDFEFHSLHPRSFITIDVDVTEAQEPGAELARRIEQSVAQGCVLRVRFRLSEEQLSTIDQKQLREAARPALTVQFKPEVVHHQREVRMPGLTESSVVTPLAALSTFLEQVAPERKEALLAKAEQLCRKLEGQR